jgi:hypothetical protein
LRKLKSDWYRWWYDKTSPVRDFYYMIRDGVTNLIEYLPIIWKDRNFDFNYLFILMQYKLKKLEKHHREYGVSKDKDRYANEIKLCINLLERIIKDDYLLIVDKPYKINFNKGSKRKYDHADYLREQDLDLLFKYMRKHVEGWWD